MGLGEGEGAFLLRSLASPSTTLTIEAEKQTHQTFYRLRLLLIAFPQASFAKQANSYPLFNL